MGNIEPEVSDFKSLFWGVPKSLINKMEEFKGRDINSICERLAYKERFSKVRVLKNVLFL